MTPQDIGRRAAFEELGLVKSAATPLFYKAPLMKRVGKWLGSKAHSIAEMAIGSPRRFGRELMSGRALRKGSLIRESLDAPDMLSKAFFYGLPAYEAGSILLDKDPDKAKRVGASLGGAALGLATWRPLGMVGSIGADIAGRSVGGAVGGTLGGLAERAGLATPKPAPPPLPEHLEPYYGRSASRFVTPARTGRTLGMLSQLPVGG